MPTCSLLAGIKPVACSKHLCSHQFDEMGFGASMDIIYNFPTVADLLISMAAAAASNPNKQHRQRFFACPNPPSDFVSGESARRDTITDLNETMGIKWENLQEVWGAVPACLCLVHVLCLLCCVVLHRWLPAVE